MTCGMWKREGSTKKGQLRLSAWLKRNGGQDSGDPGGDAYGDTESDGSHAGLKAYYTVWKTWLELRSARTPCPTVTGP